MLFSSLESARDRRRRSEAGRGRERSAVVVGVVAEPVGDAATTHEGRDETERLARAWRRNHGTPLFSPPHPLESRRRPLGGRVKTKRRVSLAHREGEQRHEPLVLARREHAELAHTRANVGGDGLLALL